jgi:hypothetical protein
MWRGKLRAVAMSMDSTHIFWACLPRDGKTQAGETITRGTMGYVRFVRGQRTFEETRDSIFV